MLKKKNRFDKGAVVMTSKDHFVLLLTLIEIAKRKGKSYELWKVLDLSTHRTREVWLQL